MAEILLEEVTRRFGGGAPAVDSLSLSVPSGSFLALLGPSGCGKTTALRLIAGLERPDGGAIRIGGRAVAADGLFVEPEDRGLGMVFQSYALWPHMDVAANIEFGLKAKGLSRPERQTRISDALDLVGLSQHARRRPHELSGGQRQRVALARSLAARAPVILLDEPLANLDAHLREQMQAEFRRIHREARTTFVFVTHDQAEAMALADIVAVMDKGRLQQVADVETLFHRPASPMVARFIAGGRTVKVNVSSERAGEGLCRVHLQRQVFDLPGDAPAGPGLLCLRARDLRIVTDDASGPSLSSRVEDARFENGDHLVSVVLEDEPDGARLTVRSPVPLRKGERLRLVPTSGWVLEART